MSKAAKSDRPDRQILEGIGTQKGVAKDACFETLKGQILEGFASRIGRTSDFLILKAQILDGICSRRVLKKVHF